MKLIKYNQPRFIKILLNFLRQRIPLSSLHTVLVNASENINDLAYRQANLHYTSFPFKKLKGSFYLKEPLNFKFGSFLTIFLTISYAFLAYFAFSPLSSCPRQNKKEARRGKRKRRQEELEG